MTTSPAPAASGPRSLLLGRARLLITLAVGLAVLVYALDLTVVSTAAPTIIAEFHDQGLFGWLFAAYSVPVAATTLLYGRLGDVYGRKRPFSAALLGFLAASVACGFATTMAQLIAFRVLQGLCAGVLLGVGFVTRERTARLPLLPLRVLWHRGLGGALLTIALLIWIVDSLLFFIPTLAQEVFDGTVQAAGIILIPLMLTWSLTALVSLRVGQRYGFRLTALGGCAALAASLVALSLAPSTGGQGVLVVPMLLAGLGAGMINPNMMLLAQNSLSDRDQGLAGGLGGCVQVLVAAIVAPLLAALELGRLAAHFGGRLPDTSRLLSAQGRASLRLQYGSIYVRNLHAALNAALHDVFAVGFIALVAVTVGLILIVPSNAVARRIRLAPLGR